MRISHETQVPISYWLTKCIVCIPNTITVLRYSTTTIFTTKDDATVSVLRYCRACAVLTLSREKAIKTNGSLNWDGKLPQWSKWCNLD